MYFAVKMRLCFSRLVSSENYVLNRSTSSPSLSTHLNVKAKNSFMRLIMLLLLHLISGLSVTCPHCLLRRACIPSSYIFIMFASRPFIPFSALAFFLIVPCLWSSGCKLCHPLSLFCVLCLWYSLFLSLITSLRSYSLTVAPFHSRGTYC